MNITRQRAAQFALLAKAAEEMTSASPWPLLPAAVDSDWMFVGHLSAANALFGTQQLGLGDRCYYGYVAVSRTDNSEFVVVVRGTESTIEWFEDAEAAVIPGPAGFVHHGFYTLYDSMRYHNHVDANERAAVTIAGLTMPKKLTVIGHSLGSALATYLLAEIKLRSPAFELFGCLFASPKPGDGQFGHWFDLTVGHDNYVVFNYIRDVVPRLPLGLPWGLGFQALPSVVVLTPSMSEVVIGDNVKCAHNAASYAALLDPTVVDATANPCIQGVSR